MKKLAVLGMGWLVLCSTAARACDDKTSAWVGVYLGPVPEALSSQLKLEGQGVVIQSVIKDSPAEAAGLKDHDIVTDVNDQAVKSVEDFVKTIQGFSPNQPVNLNIIREGQDLSVQVTLGTRPREFGMTFDKDFKWEGDPFGGRIFMHDFGGNAELNAKIHEAMADAQAGDVKVNVECKEGKGTVTIDKNGEVTSEEFDCSGQGAGHIGRNVMVFKKKLGDGDANFDFNMELPEGVEGLKDKIQTFAFSAKPRTSFRVEDGKIEVTLRKGDTELTEVYASENDLAQKNPDLYRQYQEMQDELNK